FPKAQSHLANFKISKSPVSAGSFKISKAQSHLTISNFKSPVSSDNFKFQKPSFAWPISPVSTLAHQAQFPYWPISPISMLAHKPVSPGPISPISMLAHKPSSYTGP
ncbi:hypothetical protein V8G54_035879, partial [Vigna mungo]